MSRTLPALLLCLALVGCAGEQTGSGHSTGAVQAPSPSASTPATPDPATASPLMASSTVTPTPSPSSQTPNSSPANTPQELVLAFAGDSNAFEGGGVSVEKGLGEAGRLLAAADIASVNLETALAEDPSGLPKQPKLYTFLTDSAFPRMLAREGVDVVSLANNHAMDYGTPGMERTLAIREQLADRLPMVGIGRDPQEAFAPVVTSAKGRTVVFHAGNDILEDTMDWFPRGGRPGVAMVKTEEQFAMLLDSVHRSRGQHPDAVVVVWMHWGVDYQVCTTHRQERRAAQLAEAGADVVVGTHAHRVQRMETIGSTLVAYGLGNFNFSSDRVATRETGVLTVRIPLRGTPTGTWAPGRIVGGRPVMLHGAEQAAATQRWRTLPGGC